MSNRVQRSVSRCALFAAAAFTVAGFAQSASAVVYNPTQIRTAYGLNGLTFNGTAANGAGQTIAIIDWYNDPNIATETAKFNAVYGLQTFNSGGPTLTVRSQTGTSTLPSTTTTSLETALDVQWAHAIAPMANILLVEPNTASFADTNAAVTYAKGVAGVSSLSMSYGADSFNGELTYDAPFASQAAGHTGVTFFASTGDTTTPSYPATSSHVVAVGGTRLTLNGSNVRTAETVWANSNGTEGAGFAAQVARPTFQNSVSTNAKRGIPDLVMDGDPASGVYVYFGAGANPTQYSGVGGTSLSAPMMAGLMAVANQGRALNGLTPLTSDQTLTMLYALLNADGTPGPLYSQCFYDVTSGSANGYAAAVGYDTPSGLGAPKADGLIQYLAGNLTVVPEPSSLGLLMIGGTMMARRRHAR